MDSEWLSDDAIIPVECSSKCCGGCSIPNLESKFEPGVILELKCSKKWEEALEIVTTATKEFERGVITSDECAGVHCVQRKRMYREAMYLNDVMWQHEIDSSK